MLSDDLENLIEQKRRELEKEKSVLGLSEENDHVINNTNVDNKENLETFSRRVTFSQAKALSENNETTEEESEEKDISPDLDRYIRRYLGLPMMLKAGEYSPNNPLIRGERTTGDVLLGLGEYERRRNTLRKIRQKQYKEYLDEQAKIKQEEREKAERERKEREEKERLAEERERERERLELERDRHSPERRSHSFSCSSVSGANNAYNTKVDTGVQVGRHAPLSVAVQTDENDLFPVKTGIPLPSKLLLTQAERELSPRTVADVPPATWHWAYKDPSSHHGDDRGRRRSYGDFDARTSSISKEKQTYRPSILDADVISLRNLQAEKDAAARRQFYQQELRSQIEEQQRIREERKSREKLLEQAEMRRLEQQLRSLKMAQESELDRQKDISAQMKQNYHEYDSKRTLLQRDIELEQRCLKAKNSSNQKSQTSQSDPSNYYLEKPYTVNIPEKSMFSPNYDLENYLRKNLNPSKESLMTNIGKNYKDRQENRQIMSKSWHEGNGNHDYSYPEYNIRDDMQVEMPWYENGHERKHFHGDMYDRGDIHQGVGDKRQERRHFNERIPEDKQEIRRRNDKIDSLPIPVLRHSPKHKNTEIHQELNEGGNIQDDMQVEMPWYENGHERKHFHGDMYDRGDIHQGVGDKRQERRHFNERIPEDKQEIRRRNDKIDSLPIPVLRHSPKHKNTEIHQELNEGGNIQDDMQVEMPWYENGHERKHFHGDMYDRGDIHQGVGDKRQERRHFNERIPEDKQEIRRRNDKIDSLPIPVLRHSPKHKNTEIHQELNEGGNIQDDMQVEMPWYENGHERKHFHGDMYDRGDIHQGVGDKRQERRHFPVHKEERIPEDKQEIRKRNDKIDSLPIPVLRHSPKHKNTEIHQELNENYEKNEEFSEEMKQVDDKWKVPAVQKNILKSLQSEGRNINILTQLGSIRRQLQLEQMKLDKVKQTDV